VRAETRIAATIPTETLAAVQAFFAGQIAEQPLRAIGVASFGPLDLDKHSETYGCITTTPKPRWSNIDLVGPLRQAFGLPVGFDTDVNGAALGEYRWGAAQGLRDFIYLTVGAGIGGGGMLNGSLMHGLVHPEMGHMRVPHDRSADPFEGACPYHGDCLEGLASGPAIAARTGRPAEDLPDDHQAWPLVAGYLAAGLANLILALSPQRIILGGGVMRRRHLFAMIRGEVQALLNGYVPHRSILGEINTYIVPPALGERAGVLGAVALAQMAAKDA
jgi:fructokinase